MSVIYTHAQIHTYILIHKKVWPILLCICTYLCLWQYIKCLCAYILMCACVWSYGQVPDSFKTDFYFLLMKCNDSSGEWNGSPLQSSCLDRGAWLSTVQGVARVGHNLVTKRWQTMIFLNIIAKYFPKWNTSEDFGIIHCNLKNYIFPLYESFKARKWNRVFFAKDALCIYMCIHIHLCIKKIMIIPG